VSRAIRALAFPLLSGCFAPYTIEEGTWQRFIALPRESQKSVAVRAARVSDGGSTWLRGESIEPNAKPDSTGRRRFEVWQRRRAAQILLATSVLGFAAIAVGGFLIANNDQRCDPPMLCPRPAEVGGIVLVGVGSAGALLTLGFGLGNFFKPGAEIANPPRGIVVE
jgi:hypothetical protein